MKPKVYCIPTEKGIHSFYLKVGKDQFYLFSQAYRRGVDNYYGKGVYINQALMHSKAHNDSAIIRTMDRIPVYIRFIEKEYGIEVMKRTKIRNYKNYQIKSA